MKNRRENCLSESRFEKLTSYCPWLVADQVVWEVEVYFQEPLPPLLAGKIAARACRVLAAKKDMRRQFSNWHSLKAFMRHWLAAALAQENPVLFRQLPESFKVGQPLPLQPLSRPRKVRRKADRPAHFAHGCELLAA